MESPALTGLRSRSRSKTPSADSNHLPKSSRKTSGGRNTPLKSLSVLVERATPELESAAPSHRTRSTVAALVSDYSDESPDVIPRSKEQLQNKLNAQYEYSRVTTTSTRSENLGSDFILSPSKTSSPYAHTYNANFQRSYSPAASACSTDSSFAEQALADISRVTEREPDSQHLPYKLYKMAGEYWNKYPKTDYTYSPLSRDRVELAPGQVAVPNMSRRSLAQYRVHGDLTSQSEIDTLLQHAGYDSSEEEYVKKRVNGASVAPRGEQRWWLTRLIITVYTIVTSTVSETWTRVTDGASGRGGFQRYQQQKPGLVSRAASASMSPLVWIYKLLKTVVTTTTTTITNTMNGNTEADGAYYSRGVGSVHAAGAARVQRGRRLWPWLLLLLLPLLGYASYYTYENFDNLTVPDFSKMTLDLAEFSALTLSSIRVPNVSLPFEFPDFAVPNLNFSLPDIDLLPKADLSLPDMPEIPEAYFHYKEMVQGKFGNATDYAMSTFEEMRRLYNNMF